MRVSEKIININTVNPDYYFCFKKDIFLCKMNKSSRDYV